MSGVSISIEPLATPEGGGSFLSPSHHRYGLHEGSGTRVAGHVMVRWQGEPMLRVISLLLTWHGRTENVLPARTGEQERRERILVREERALLPGNAGDDAGPVHLPGQRDRTPPDTWFARLPFIFALDGGGRLERWGQSHSDPSRTGPPPTEEEEGGTSLLPPSTRVECRGMSITTRYTLTAELVLPGFLDLSFFQTHLQACVEVPLRVFDASLIPYLLLREPKVWKSPPAHYPLEYHVTLASSILGPGDPVLITYHLRLHDRAVAEGMALKGVKATLKQHLWAGELGAFAEYLQGELGGSVGQRDRTSTPATNATSSSISSGPIPSAQAQEVDGRPPTRARVKRTQILLKHEHALQDQQALLQAGGACTHASATLLLGHVPTQLLPTTTTPTDAHWLSASLYHPTSLATTAHHEARHSMTVTLSLWNGEDIPLPTGLLLAPMSTRECEGLLDACPEAVPGIEYSRVSGGEPWVPAYQPPAQACP